MRNIKTQPDIEDKWLDKLKGKMSDYEMDAPDGLWESIQNEMPASHKAGNFRAALSRLRLPLIAAAVMLLLGGTVYFSIMLTDSKSMNLTAYTESGAAQEHISGSKSKVSDNPDSPATAYNHLAETNSNAAPYRHNSGNIPMECKSETSCCDTVADTHADFDGADNEASSDSDEKSSGGDNASKIDEAKKMSLWAHDNAFTQQHRKGRSVINRPGRVSGRVSIGVITSAGIYDLSDSSNSGTSNTGSDIPDFNDNSGSNNPGSNDNNGSNSGDTPDFVDPGGETEDNDGKDDNNDDNSKRECKSMSTAKPAKDEFSHHTPIRFGMTFMYNISKRIGLETGIVYTNLNSDIRYGSGSETFSHDAKQSLHYIGIPLNVKYKPFSWKRLDLYVSGGVMVEKCVAADIKDDNPQGASGSKTYHYGGIGERPFQFSVNASAGLQFNISDIIGIYAEPGVSYFFNDNSGLRTIYKDKPFNFSFTLGLRLSFGK